MRTIRLRGTRASLHHHFITQPQLRRAMRSALTDPWWHWSVQEAEENGCLALRRVHEDSLAVAGRALPGEAAPVLTRYAVSTPDGRLNLPRRVRTYSRGARRLHLREATVTAGWDFIRFGESAILPGLTPETEWLLKVSEFESVSPPANALRGWSAEHFYIKEQAASAHFESAVALFGHHMSQWGHCVMDLVPRVLGHEDAISDYPVLIQADTPKNVEELLRLLLPGSNIVRVPFGTTVTVDRLIFPLPRMFYPAYWRYDADVHRASAQAWISDKTALQEMQRRLALPVSEPPDGRVFLSRSGLHNRQVANIDAIEAVLHQEAFQCIKIEEHSIEDARRLLSTTQFVVSSQGSNLLNLLFLAPPGLSVLIIGGRRGARFRRQYSAAGHRLLRVHGRRIWPDAPANLTRHDIKQLPIRVSPTRFARYLRALVKAR